MENTELKAKKRRRKHGSTAEEFVTSKTDSLAVIPSVSGNAKPEAKRTKKRKREHVAEEPENAKRNSKVQDEQKGLTKTENAEEKEEDQDDQKGPTDIDIPSTSALSLPITGADPKRFSDLGLSRKSMHALEEMGFEEMTVRTFRRNFFLSVLPFESLDMSGRNTLFLTYSLILHILRLQVLPPNGNANTEIATGDTEEGDTTFASREGCIRCS